MLAKAIMIQGTGSSVGKSVIATALCRIFTDEGYRVRPFKAQNMSNNAFATLEGGEIGRAQAEQAWACGVEPSVVMNPVLLKPTTDLGAQVVLLGQPIGVMASDEYRAQAPRLMAAITEAWQAIAAQADIVVIEGAGSPAEINLKDRDLVNMRIAELAEAPVILIGDIERGGVFAQLVGTMELLEPSERERVRGFIINKFRGEPRLLDSGLTWLEARFGMPVLGVIPYLHDIAVAEEDSLTDRLSPSWSRATRGGNGHAVQIEVVSLPRISNFTDFDALKREPDVEVRFVERPSARGMPDAIILPGTKSTIGDLAFLRAQGFEEYLHRCREAGVEIVGICGGFQMLGERIRDPHRVEAAVDEAPGLGFLPGVTVFQQRKIVCQRRATHLESGLSVVGYEIHVGEMQASSRVQPVLQYLDDDGRPLDQRDGLRSQEGRVWGTHLHGLFDAPAFRAWWLNRLRTRHGLPAQAASPARDDPYSALAAQVRPHLKMTAIYQMLGLT